MLCFMLGFDHFLLGFNDETHEHVEDTYVSDEKELNEED